MEKQMRRFSSLILLGIIIIGLYLTRLHSYLLFHSLAELFSIVIGFSLFIIAWHARGYFRERFDYLTFIGIAYGFVAGLDMLHLLAFKGMQIFTGYDYYANQLWVGARYMEALTLLVPFVFLNRSRRLQPAKIIAAYSLATAALIASILHFRVFPVCYVEGQGQTPFKVVSEFIIILLLAAAAILLNRNRRLFGPAVYRKLQLSVVFTILSEFAFTLYFDNHDIVNQTGHIFKIISFYLMYEAVIITCITQPYETIFKELTDKEALLRQAAMTDELTGLYNRHYLDVISNTEMERADRYGKPLSLVIADLDHFKRINDTWGHPAGDEMLRCVADILRKAVRASDILIRFGGEEFVVLMPETDLAGACAAAEKLRATLAASPLPISGMHTLSLGVAERFPAESFRSCYKRADAALYRAKQAGRDRVEAASGPGSETGLALRPIEWRPEWASGHAETDRQHQELIEQAGQVLGLVTPNSEGRELLTALDRLMESIARHFDYEQERLRSAGASVATASDWHGILNLAERQRSLVGRALRNRKAFTAGQVQILPLLSFIQDDLILDHLTEFHGIIRPELAPFPAADSEPSEAS